MPRPAWTQNAWPWLFAVLLATLPPPVLEAGLAAAAATLFEAAPFVLAAEALAPARWPAFIETLGCGCGRTVPGALALPAVALAWLSFGPAVALARTAAALALLFLPKRRREPHQRGVDAFAELAGLVPAALLAALAAQTSELAALPASNLPAVAALTFGAGAILGALVPCATAGVALAAGMGPRLPYTAAGILFTAGLLPPLRFRPRAPAASRGAAAASPRGAALASVLLALALGGLALHVRAGLVNPRLSGLALGGAVLALLGAQHRTTRAGRALAVPAALLATLAAGTPAPLYHADPTSLGGAFAGEPLAFTGVATSARGATTLERFTITCCRIDAARSALRLDRTLPVANGSWVAASGRLRRAPDGTLVLHPARWRGIAAPRDPFSYR